MAAAANAGFISEGIQAQQSGDHKKLAEIYERACGLENKASGCYNLAVLYFEGTGNVEKNFEKAISLYEKACSAKFALACNNLGYIYESGNGADQNFTKAAAYYEKACKDNEGCTSLGLLYANGAGLAKDVAKAASL